MARTRTAGARAGTVRTAGPQAAGMRAVKAGGSGTWQAGHNMDAAVLAFKNRLLSVYRGQNVSAYGDVSDVGSLYLQNVPAAIAETHQTTFDPATQRQQTIRTISAVVPGWADIIETDTLFDPASSLYFMIETIEARPGIGYYPAEKLLTLRVRSGVSISSD